MNNLSNRNLLKLKEDRKQLISRIQYLKGTKDDNAEIQNITNELVRKLEEELADINEKIIDAIDMDSEETDTNSTDEKLDLLDTDDDFDNDEEFEEEDDDDSDLFSEEIDDSEKEYLEEPEVFIGRKDNGNIVSVYSKQKKKSN